MDQTQRFVLALGLTWVAMGCQEQPKPAANPKACAELSKPLCKGDPETIATCKSTLDLLSAEVCSSALANVDHSLQKLAMQRKKCDELVAKLCSDLGAESEGCTMVKESAPELSHQRCESMLGEYPEVLADLKRQDEQSKPLSPEVQAKLTQGAVPSFGPTDAKVTIVEFSDFECPYCSRAADVAHAVRAKYAEQVRFVFRQYPLSFHEHAQLSAEASLAAHAQGKFWELHDKMFANQGALDRSSIEGYARDLGLDMAQFNAALDDKRYKSTIDAELDLGEETAVDGTPTMFINGQRIANPTSVESVSGAIDRALAKAKS